MVITDRFVYIHMPKTGGTFVEEALRILLAHGEGCYLDTSTSAGRRSLGVRDQHQWVADIPPAHRGLPVICTVRNPYEHWVSFYEFRWWKDHPGDEFDEELIRSHLPHFPDLSFREYVESSYDFRLLNENYVTAVASALQGADVGPLTLDYIRYLADRPQAVLARLSHFLQPEVFRRALPNVTFLRMENLNRELYDFLISVRYPPEEVEFVLHMDRVYPDEKRRPRVSWETYYTAVLRRLVRNKERLLFSMFPEYDV